jgi:glycosyltransferase involved in cell wall biosynthesis
MTVAANGQRAMPKWHIAIVAQRFLPYHVARIRRLRERCAELGYRLTAIEVASQDESYQMDFRPKPADYDRICCFPGTSYHAYTARQIHAKVLAMLTDARPDVVFAPATPFPEGMAAVVYRRQSSSRMIMMDDAWEHTDHRGALVHWVKSLIHSNIDGVFIPAPTHAPHYRMLGFPEERIFFGVDVVDNDKFATGADRARAQGAQIKVAGSLLDDYFLFVGRFAPKKGLQTLLPAYARYRKRVAGKPWELVVVGGGRGLEDVWRMGAGIEGVHFAGPQYGDELCSYYGRAKALVVPSEMDQWGLVVNEGLAAGLPVIVCTGCGAARTLVAEGENGWCFPPRDEEALAELLLRAGACAPDALARMGAKSREIIGAWSLDRFVDGVFQAMQVPRSAPGGVLADVATRLWKGRIRVN